MSLAIPITSRIRALCRGDIALLDYWLNEGVRPSLLFCIPAIIIGCGAYGFSMGIWHGAEMASYVALKLPLLILSILVINGIINGMLAMVLGSGIGFRHSIQFLLTGFALMSIILLSLSPIVIYIVLQAPSPTSPNAKDWHSMSMLIHTAVIAYAGVTSHRSLLRHVQSFATTAKHGGHAFIAWLLGNLFVGAQLSWIMRPFFGTPGTEIQLLRDDPMSGNFYEALWNAFQHFL